MRLLSFLFFSVFFASSLHAQQLHVGWTRFIGSNVIDVAKGAIATRDNGIVFTGGTHGSNNGDIPFTPLNNLAVSMNVVVGKMDSNKQISWIKVYGGTDDDYGMRVIQTADDGFAVLANAASGDGDVVGNHAAGAHDIWLLKLDAQGNKQWAKCFGSVYDEQAISIKQTSDKGFILFGNTNGSGGDIPLQYVQSQFTSDWFVVKTDSLGNKQWSKTIGGTGDEWGFGSVIVANNFYYLVSSSTSRDYECVSDTTWHSGTESLADYYIIQLDSIGNVMWCKSYGGRKEDIAVDAICDVRDSSIVIVGMTRSYDFMVTGNPANNNHSSDMWVMKTDRNGNFIWGSTLGDSSDEVYWMSIALAPNGGYYALCHTELNTSLPPNHVGEDDVWLFLLNSAGSMVANKVIGGTQYDYPAAVVPFKNGYCIVGESTSNQFTEGVNLTSNHGISDIYISGIDYWPTSVEEVSNRVSLKVYPNPSNGFVRIEMPESRYGGQLSISNAEGQKIYTASFKAGAAKTEICTENWPKGVFVVKWESKTQKTIAIKLTVN